MSVSPETGRGKSLAQSLGNLAFAIWVKILGLLVLSLGASYLQDVTDFSFSQPELTWLWDWVPTVYLLWLLATGLGLVVMGGLQSAGYKPFRIFGRLL